MKPNSILSIVTGFTLDAVFGDPAWVPHPVRLIGMGIQKAETFTRKKIRNERVAGMVTVCLVVAASYLLVKFSVSAAFRISARLGFAVESLWIFLGLAMRGLSDAALPVADSLEKGDLQAARKEVGQIVGRDTGRLDEAGISRAAIESVSESTIDGAVSPLIFAGLGGAPWLWVFKAVSTCDSMIGYKNARYHRFGTFGARLDDAANFLPARLGFLLFPFAARLCGESQREALHIAWRDRKVHASPNAGIPEAAMAGALRVRLGGPAWYDGELEPKAYFGAEFADPTPGHIRRAVKLSWTVSLLALLSTLLIRPIIAGLSNIAEASTFKSPWAGLRRQAEGQFKNE